jgi:NAD(P)-dependent dehydrogenase (short-subunit alcohol dehydrogenase family)
MTTAIYRAFAVVLLAITVAGISGCTTGTAVTQPELQADAPTVFVTGSNRGLGLEFARQYAAKGWNVIATARRPEASAELQTLAAEYPQVALDTLDVTVQADVERVAERFRDQPVDVLINNAGIWGDLDAQTFGQLDYDAYKWIYEVNALGPLRVTEALLANVEASKQKKIITLGGGMGTRNTVEQAPGGHYWYRMSRAANLISMAIVQRETRKRGVIVGIISPGKVDTQMLKDSGWPEHFKKISPRDSAALVIEQIALLTPEQGGELINYDGKVIGW